MKKQHNEYRDAIERGEIPESEIKKIIEADLSDKTIKQREHFKELRKKHCKFKRELKLPDGSTIIVQTNKETK